ncbi:hypothetical protein H2201_004572 [Coniosporium apollinis]|uniref:Right handed beta helix domain-containing protein n=1 Tax=Coniosporium apollinis TaxID=61459 RepID=A0ABQ9NSA0_9PEZI|nr:hypothetical protein H2201_004572 [Coniosporium apollinis]
MSYLQHYPQRPSEVVANGVSSAISTVEAALIQHLREQAAEPLDDHETSEADTPDAADPERPYKTPKKRRHRYTREQKLAAIHYATTATKPGPDGTPQPIEGLEAAKHLNITWGMLRDWVANKTKIENMRPGSVKYRKGQTIHGGIQKVYRKRGPPEWDPQRGPRPLAPRDPSAPEVNDTPGGAQVPSPDTDNSPSGTAQGLQNPRYSLQNREDVSVTRAGALRRRPARQVRVEHSNLDEQSSSINSDVRFSTLQCSQVQTSTVHSCQLAASHVQGGCYVVQSTIRTSYVSDESEVRASCMVNSLVRGAKLTNCTVTNSRIMGGDHHGKTFVNTTIDGNGQEDASRLTHADFETPR